MNKIKPHVAMITLTGEFAKETEISTFFRVKRNSPTLLIVGRFDLNKIVLKPHLVDFASDFHCMVAGDSFVKVHSKTFLSYMSL